jgi:hypothetical protein
VYRCRCCCCKESTRQDFVQPEWLTDTNERSGTRQRLGAHLSIYSAHGSVSSRATAAEPPAQFRESFAQRQSQRFKELQRQIAAAEDDYWLKQQVRGLKSYSYERFFSSQWRATAVCVFVLFSCALTTYASVRIRASVDRHEEFGSTPQACEHMAASKNVWIALLVTYWTLVVAVAPLALWLREYRKGRAAAATAAREGTQMMSGGGGGGGGSSSPWGSGDAYTRESGTTRSSRRRVGAEGLSDAAMDRLLAQQDAAMTAPPEPEPEPEPEIELY